MSCTLEYIAHNRAIEGESEASREGCGDVTVIRSRR